ncbi:MAG TPA: sugar transferase [Gemmatimonadales bacterium]|nr:sugar transferase [Gemmatimonadales bacterium]
MTRITSSAAAAADATFAAPAAVPARPLAPRRAPRTAVAKGDLHDSIFHEADRERPRRLLNILVAVAGLVIASPIMLLVAVLVKLTSRGPVFYSQTRIGLDRRDPKVRAVHARRSQDQGGQPFTIYKFRTMRVVEVGADAQVWARPDDPRVTSIGRLLRKYRLDELPQLFNVLRGDMNVVGPRPEQPRIFDDLRVQVHGYQVRQRVRPGITGWAQVNQHYDNSVDDVRRKVQFDLEYIRRQSFSEDCKIMLQTVPVIVFRKGAW